MKFSTILGLAAASAAPAASENISIKKFSLDLSINNTIDYVYFELSGKNATELICDAYKPVYPEPTHATQCGRDSKYYFQLLPGTDGYRYRLSIFHDDDIPVIGSGNVPTSCRAVGHGLTKGTLCVEKRGSPLSISLA